MHLRHLATLLLPTLAGCGTLVQVMDAEGRPVEAALVQLVDGSFISGNSRTDSLGMVLLHPGWLFPDNMLLVTTADGYKWWVTGIPKVVYLGGPSNNASEPISPERQRNPFLPAGQQGR